MKKEQQLRTALRNYLSSATNLQDLDIIINDLIVIIEQATKE